MKPEEYKQMTAFARQDGMVMGVLWVLSFVCFANMFEYPSLSLVCDVSFLAIPVILFFMVRRYRDHVLEGHISFPRAMAYGFGVCLCATLLLAMGQWVYFEYIDGGAFFANMKSLFTMPEYQELFVASGFSLQDLKMVIDGMAETRPIDLAFSFISQNVFLSLVLSLVMGAIVRKPEPR